MTRTGEQAVRAYLDSGNVWYTTIRTQGPDVIVSDGRPVTSVELHDALQEMPGVEFLGIGAYQDGIAVRPRTTLHIPIPAGELRNGDLMATGAHGNYVLVYSAVLDEDNVQVTIYNGDVPADGPSSLPRGELVRVVRRGCRPDANPHFFHRFQPTAQSIWTRCNCTEEGGPFRTVERVFSWEDSHLAERRA